MGLRYTDDWYKDQLQTKNITIVNLDPYVKSKIHIKHKCTNNHIWLATPSKILAGRGCPECSKILLTRTHSSYVTQLSKDYEVLEVYSGTHNKILHRHTICGHEWTVRPSSLLLGKGCPKCSNTGFDETKPASLYFVSFENENNIYYKIGITNRTPKERLVKDWSLYNIKVMWEIKFILGIEAKIAEKEFIKNNSKFLCNTGLLSSGNTETFNTYLEYNI